MKKWLMFTTFGVGLLLASCGNAEQEAKDKAAADSLVKAADEMESKAAELDKTKQSLEEKTKAVQDSVNKLLQGI